MCVCLATHCTRPAPEAYISRLSSRRAIGLEMSSALTTSAKTGTSLASITSNKVSEWVPTTESLADKLYKENRFDVGSHSIDA